MTVRNLYPNFQAEFRGRSKYFSASRYGSPGEAYRAAREWERKAQASAPEIKRSPQANNTSGVTGIRAEFREYSGGHQYLYVCASWVKAGRPCSSSVSVNKHGALEAVKIAIKRREKGAGKPVGLSPRQVLDRLQIGVRG